MRWVIACLMFTLTGTVSAQVDRGGREGNPTVAEFLGLNTHTVQFKAQRYQGVVRRLRDYHPVQWDLAETTHVMPPWPRAKNGVDWRDVYRSWTDAGYDPNVCLMLSRMEAANWTDLPRDASVYAQAFASGFGPNGVWPHVTSIGIGNEPGHLSDEDYLTVFDAMAKAIRRADADVLITTCNVKLKPSGKYWKDVALFKDRTELFDALTTHSYAQAEGWPTWRRSYPEDPSLDFLDELRSLLAWRDKHAPGKQLWVNEFGWDASTQDPPDAGDFKDWVDVSDLDQARYLVRATLLFMRLGLDRGYIYFFDDQDKPSVHASSGIMRHGKPKPAWYMLRQFQSLLGEYRFVEAVEETPERYVYQLAHRDGLNRLAWVVWAPKPAKLPQRWPNPAPGATWSRLTGTPAGPELLPQDASHLELTGTPIVGMLRRDR